MYVQVRQRYCCRRYPSKVLSRISASIFWIFSLTTLVNCGHCWISFSIQNLAHQKVNGILFALNTRRKAYEIDNDNQEEFPPSSSLPAPVATEQNDGDQGTTINRKEVSLIDVAASITKDSFRLLGIKSLGVDYGLVRTGLAVTVGFEPKPIAILSDLNNTQVCGKVVEYARLEQVQRIIVGLPLHKNGTFAEQTNLTLTFGFELMEHALRSLGPDVPVYFFDERYTSKEAAARARTRNPRSLSSSSADLYGTLDADAACIILENYYQDNGMGAHHYKLPKELHHICLQDYQERALQRQIQMQNLQSDRELRLRTRKEAIAIALDSSQKAEALYSWENKCSKKGKKKKKKR